ncbi:MAG: hypothetical protein ACHQ3P_11760 [Candidatus Limnocylindrales bacterium]
MRAPRRSTRAAAGPSDTGSRLAAAVVVLAGAFIIGVALEGCGLAASTAGVPPTPTVAVPSYSTTIAETRRQVASALDTQGLELSDATEPFRPPEPPTMFDTPRAVFQVVLPADPSHGYLVIYEFRDVASAAAAGADLASYYGSGPGRVQFPPDTQHVIRQVNTTLVVYSWSPVNASDPNESKISTSLGTVGTGIDVHS